MQKLDLNTKDLLVKQSALSTMLTVAQHTLGGSADAWFLACLVLTVRFGKILFTNRDEDLLGYFNQALQQVTLGKDAEALAKKIAGPGVVMARGSNRVM